MPLHPAASTLPLGHLIYLPRPALPTARHSHHALPAVHDPATRHMSSVPVPSAAPTPFDNAPQPPQPALASSQAPLCAVHQPRQSTPGCPLTLSTSSLAGEAPLLARGASAAAVVADPPADAASKSRPGDPHRQSDPRAAAAPRLPATHQSRPRYPGSAPFAAGPPPAEPCARPTTPARLRGCCSRPPAHRRTVAHHSASSRPPTS